MKKRTAGFAAAMSRQLSSVWSDEINFFAGWRSAECPSDTQFTSLNNVSEGHSAEGFRAKKFISSLLRTKFLVLPLIICVLISCQSSLYAHALRRPEKPRVNPLRIQSAKAATENGFTILDVVLNGAVKPVLKADGSHLILTLPHAAPDAMLGANLSSGGAITRLSVETPKNENGDSVLTIELRNAALSEIIAAADPNTVRIRIADAGGQSVLPAVRPTNEPGFYDIEASQSSLAELLKSLAQDEGANLALTGAMANKVTVSLRKATFAQAFDLLVKSAGLAWHQDGRTFVVGTIKEIEAAFPKPQAEPVKPALPVLAQEVYHCANISAADLALALTGSFDKGELRISIGAGAITPHLDEANSGSVTGVQTGSSSHGSGAGADPGLATRDVIISGEEGIVKNALLLAKKLDRRRRQVRIDVKIADISLDTIRELGVQWQIPSYVVHESAGNSAASSGAAGSTGSSPAGGALTSISGLGFGTFVHDPITIGANVFAQDNHNGSKLLASPSLTMLDGEHGYILIGQRLKYQKLVSASATTGPQYDVAEERVGIYLQVAAQISDSGEITLALYPQISTVSGYLTIAGSSLPQISTREQQTTIRVKDGAQVIIGGLLRDDEIKNIQRVPFLANLPFFGELFTYRKTTHNKSDVVIMLHPTLLED